jgi:hypothetical protein
MNANLKKLLELIHHRKTLLLNPWVKKAAIL